MNLEQEGTFIILSAIHWLDEEFGSLGEVGDLLVPDPFLLTVCDPDDPPDKRRMVFVSRREIETRIKQVQNVMAILSPDLRTDTAGSGIYEIWHRHWQDSFFGPDWDDDLYEIIVTGIAEAVVIYGVDFRAVTGLLVTFGLNRRMTTEEYDRLQSRQASQPRRDWT